MPNFFRYSKQADETTKDAQQDDAGIDIREMKICSQLTMKEREKIYFAADLVQKNYLELRKDQHLQNVSLDKLIDAFIEKGQAKQTSAADLKEAATAASETK